MATAWSTGEADRWHHLHVDAQGSEFRTYLRLGVGDQGLESLGFEGFKVWVSGSGSP